MSPRTSSSTSLSGDAGNALKGSVLSFKHLSYTVKTANGPKRLVDDISVDIRAGELLAIMVSNVYDLWYQHHSLRGQLRRNPGSLRCRYVLWK